MSEITRFYCHRSVKYLNENKWFNFELNRVEWNHKGYTHRGSSSLILLKLPTSFVTPNSPTMLPQLSLRFVGSIWRHKWKQRCTLASLQVLRSLALRVEVLMKWPLTTEIWRTGEFEMASFSANYTKRSVAQVQLMICVDMFINN